MAYCLWTDVTRIITTTMEQTDVEAIIAQTDAWIDLLLGSQTAGDRLIEELSSLQSAIRVKTLQPTSFAAGEYRESHNPVPVWRARVAEITKLYKGGKVKGSSYQHINEDSRYTEDNPL